MGDLRGNDKRTADKKNRETGRDQTNHFGNDNEADINM